MLRQIVKGIKVLLLCACLSVSVTQALELQELTALLKSKKNITCDYKQVKTFQGQELNSTGSFYLIDKSTIKFSQQDPFAMDTVLNSEKLVQIIDGNEAAITKENNPQVFEVINLVMQVFSLKQDLENHFAVKLTGTLDNWTLFLEPKDELLKKVFKTILLKGSNNIQSITITDNNQDLTYLEFSNCKQ